MECFSSDPLGKDPLVGGSKFRGSCGCSLACSIQRAVVGECDASEGFVSRRGSLACSRKCDGDTSEEFGVLRKLLGLFEAWLSWACERRPFLGLHSSVGLKWRIGRFGLGRLLKSGHGLGWRRFRDRSSRVGCRSKKSSLLGFDKVRGSNACSVGLRASSGSTLRLTASEGAFAFQAPYASSCSSGECSLFAVHSPSSLKVSSPTALVEVIAAAPKQSAVGCNPTISAAELSSASLGSFALGEDPLLPSSSEVNCDLLAPSPTLDGFGLAPDVCLSEAAALGERLRFSLPVMSESGTPIYPSESKSVLKYSRKNKVGSMDKHLLEEAIETFGVPKVPSLLSFGDASKPFFEPSKDGLIPALDERCQPFLRRGFLLPKGTATSPSEVGESSRAAFVDDSSRGGGLEKLGGSPGTTIDLSLCFQTLEVSHEGNEQAFLDFMALIDAEHRLEAPVPSPKFKGCREVKNLDCTINYDARGFGSSRGKARGPLM